MRRISLFLLWAGLVTVVSWLGFEVLVAADATVSQETLSPIVVATTEATSDSSTAPTAESRAYSEGTPTTTSTEAGATTTTSDDAR